MAKSSKFVFCDNIAKIFFIYKIYKMIQESEEIVSIVNEKDELIGPSPRS
jgi:hypothetical protein